MIVVQTPRRRTRRPGQSGQRPTPERGSPSCRHRCSAGGAMPHSGMRSSGHVGRNAGRGWILGHQRDCQPGQLDAWTLHGSGRDDDRSLAHDQKHRHAIEARRAVGLARDGRTVPGRTRHGRCVGAGRYLVSGRRDFHHGRRSIARNAGEGRHTQKEACQHESLQDESEQPHGRPICALPNRSQCGSIPHPFAAIQREKGLGRPRRRAVDPILPERWRGEFLRVSRCCRFVVGLVIPRLEWRMESRACHRDTIV